MKNLYYFTFTEGSSFYGCIQPVWSNNEEQATRLIKKEFDSRNICSIYNEQQGRTTRENRGLVLLDEMGIK